jgi:hypothetical protein
MLAFYSSLCFLFYGIVEAMKMDLDFGLDKDHRLDNPSVVTKESGYVYIDQIKTNLV